MSKLIAIMSALMLLFTTGQITAQSGGPQSVEMADVLHQNGKIYLVVLVLLTIFAGIIFLLVRIERKLSRLEKEKATK